MSVICQSFIQNTWRKDLCSNCFKSKEEHGGRGRGGDATGEVGDLTFSRGSAEGGGSRRYMGVAGRVYQRGGYYNNSWKSIMIDKSDSGLKSPGLIKEMSSLVSQENEKNMLLNDMAEPDGALRSPRLTQQKVKTSQSEAKLLTEILGDRGRSDHEDNRSTTKEEDRGDVSSDLGSEASNEGSTASSGGSSASSYEVSCSAANSDTASLRSEPGSEPNGEEGGGEGKRERPQQDVCDGGHDPPLGILRKSRDSKSKKGTITFNSKLEEVIGYGGDVDYSDDEDVFDDDDDEDYDDDPADLTPDERVLRRLTDKNTEFNSDNDNLKKDIVELLPSVKELEEKRKMIIAEIEELERLGRERMKNEKAKQEDKKEDKQEGKVKLKRSPPLVSTKPLIARNNNDLRVNQVLPMKNGEVVRPGVVGDVEETPLKGIKPKYVARDEEMMEKSSPPEEELKTHVGKITSIDEVVYLSEDTKKVKVTSVDDVCVAVVDETVASADHHPQAEVKSISRVTQRDESSTKNQITEPTDSRKPITSSPGSEGLSSSAQKGTGSQNGVKYDSMNATSGQTTETKPEVVDDAKKQCKDVPLSVPRTSLLNHSRQQTSSDPAKTIPPENRKTSEAQKGGRAKSLAENKTPSPTESHTETLQEASGVSEPSVVPESLSSPKLTVQKTLNTSAKSSTEGKLAGNSKTLETKALTDLTRNQSQSSSTEVTKSSAKERVVQVAQTSHTSNLKVSRTQANQEVSRTRANQVSSVTSKGQTSQNPPEPPSGISNQNLSENKRVYNQSPSGSPKVSSNQNISKAYKTSNQNLPETSKTSPDQRLPEVSRTSNQNLPEVPKTQPNLRLSETSRIPPHQNIPDVLRTPVNQSSPEASRTSNQSLPEDSRILNNSHPEASRTSSNHSHPQASRASSNQSLPETSRTSNQSLPETSRTSNQSLPEASRISSNHSHAEASRTSSNLIHPEASRTPSNLIHSEASRTLSNLIHPEASRTPSNLIHPEASRTPSNLIHQEASRTHSNLIHQEASRTHSNLIHPEASRTPSNQSLPESSKTPASRQGSNSSLMTTFGTPLVVNSVQNSFLHSPSARTMYEDTYSSPSSLHTETTDFLKEIKSQPEVPAPTAGIQKSALYASTSCLKGLPGAKPLITPKPPKLKDKPKVPYKPSPKSSRIYATPSPVTSKVPIGNLSGAVSTPNLASMSVEDRSDTASTVSGTSSEASSTSHPDSRPEAVYKVTPEQKKPPPTTQAPAIPTFNGYQQTEVVYDVPVTLASSVLSSMPKKSSLETSSGEEKREDDATIYHEIDDSIRANRLPTLPDQTHGSSPSTSSGTPSEPGYSTTTVSHQESTRCQSRSTFEANRSMLSAALDFGTKVTRSSSGKRPAPRPPAEGEEDDGTEEASDSVEPEVPQPSVTEEASTPREPSHQQSPQESGTVAPDNTTNDGESYSSFTDDFDDDDDEEEEAVEAQPSLRKAERSSSAVPFYRNSIGPIVTHEVKGTYANTNNTPSTEAAVSTCPGGSGVLQGSYMSPTGISAGPLHSKPQASRSHSVPRAADHIVNINPSGSGGGPGMLPTSSSTSKFSFGRSGFFRPSSPPTGKRDLENTSSERGRDRNSKKTSASRFSLKKLLRLGSTGKDEEKKAAKEQEKRLARESKRNKLTIIHPLDYNQTGVEVIARPEKTSPIYDYTGIYGYIPPPQLSSKLEDFPAPMTQMTMVQASPAPSLASKRSDASAEASHSPSRESMTAYPTPLPSNIVPPVPQGSTSSVMTIGTSSSSTSNPGCSSVGVTCTSSPVVASVSTLAGGTTTPVEKRGLYARREPGVERRESETSYSSSGTASTHHHNLGYNSEGRPKPPPPPRKVSLESGQTCDIYSSLADLHATAHPHHSTTSPVDTPSRPQRPPPPVRTHSNAGTKSGPPRPDPPKLGKDSVYANLGDVRAPIMPRKPGRTASIRGEDDREKRRAPQPPQYHQHAAQEVAQQVAQRTSRHQHEDSTSSSCSSISSSRAAKGPAPARPQQPHHTSNEYEALGQDDATVFLCDSELQSASPVLYDAPLPLETRPRSPQDVHTSDGYIIPAQLRLSTVSEDTTSTLSSRQEKTGRVSVRRGSAVTHRSLEDQYGAVISANLEALSNMLDKVSSRCCPAGYEEVSYRVSRWEDVVIDDDVIVGAGHRLFYTGVVCGRDVTVMLTPETKVDAHHLLTPMPVATFKDQLPSHLLSHKYITRGKSTLGTCWVLPPLRLTTLRTMAEEDCLCSSAVPMEWERNACLLLLQLVTGLKQLQAQGVEETCIDLTLIAQGSQAKEEDSNPRLILIPPTETGTPLMSLCQCAAAASLLLMGVDEPLERAQEGNFTIPDMVPSPHAFNILLQLLRQERAGSLTQVKCVLEVLLFGPDSSENDTKEGEEAEAALQRWLDLERATVLHSLIRGPLESSVLTKFHLLFLVRTNSRILRETIKLLGDPEVTTF